MKSPQIFAKVNLEYSYATKKDLLSVNKFIYRVFAWSLSRVFLFFNRFILRVGYRDGNSSVTFSRWWHNNCRHGLLLLLLEVCNPLIAPLDFALKISSHRLSILNLYIVRLLSCLVVKLMLQCAFVDTASLSTCIRFLAILWRRILRMLTTIFQHGVWSCLASVYAFFINVQFVALPEDKRVLCCILWCWWRKWGARVLKRCSSHRLGGVLRILFVLWAEKICNLSAWVVRLLLDQRCTCGFRLRAQTRLSLFFAVSVGWKLLVTLDLASHFVLCQSLTWLFCWRRSRIAYLAR